MQSTASSTSKDNKKPTLEAKMHDAYIASMQHLYRHLDDETFKQEYLQLYFVNQASYHAEATGWLVNGELKEPTTSKEKEQFRKEVGCSVTRFKIARMAKAVMDEEIQNRKGLKLLSSVSSSLQAADAVEIPYQSPRKITSLLSLIEIFMESDLHNSELNLRKHLLTDWNVGSLEYFLKFLPHIQMIHLSPDNYLSESGERRLSDFFFFCVSRKLNINGLKTLRMTPSEINVDMLFLKNLMNTLTCLDISRVAFTAEMVSKFSNFLGQCKQLKKLKLDSTSLSEGLSKEVLAVISSPPTLTELTFNAMGRRAIEVSSDVIRFIHQKQNLTALKMKWFCFPSTEQAFGMMLNKHAGLRRLVLEGHTFDLAAIATELEGNKKITEFEIDNSQGGFQRDVESIVSKDVRALMNLNINERFRVFRISHFLSSKNILKIVSSLSSCARARKNTPPMLEELFLKGVFDNKGIATFGKFLAHPRCRLNKLNLETCDNNINDAAASEFSCGLAANNTLVDIRFPYNSKNFLNVVFLGLLRNRNITTMDDEIFGRNSDAHQKVKYTLQRNRHNSHAWKHLVVMMSSDQANQKSSIRNSIFSLLPGIMFLCDENYEDLFPPATPSVQLLSNFRESIFCRNHLRAATAASSSCAIITAAVGGSSSSISTANTAATVSMIAENPSNKRKRK